MNKKIFIIATVSLIVVLNLTPAAVSISKSVNEMDSEVMAGVGPIYVGDLYIEGTGDHDTSIVMATAEQNLKIKVDPEGSDVIIEAKYLLQCPGLLDCGYAKLWVRGAEDKEIETYDFAEGYLYTIVHDCKSGDIIEWALYVIYDDLLFPYPLTDFDAGGGICSKPVAKSRTHFLPLISRILGLLSSGQIIMKGTIVCK